MLGELPKIFGRSFVIGYFLPSLLLAGGNLELLSEFFKYRPLFLRKDLILTDVGIFVAVSWFGGILLLLVNMGLLQSLEGYGTLNPAKLGRRLQARRFAKLQTEIAELGSKRQAYLSLGQEFPQDLRMRRNSLKRHAAERFPHEETWLLPTSFGNVIRAFEVYPKVMYGIEGIQGWTRLVAVISKEYVELLDDAKGQVDFWANICFVGSLMGFVYAALATYFRQVRGPWFPIVVLLLAAIGFRMCRDAAIQWGELVKASFDVFLGDLREKLGFSPCSSKDQEKELWTRFSQAIMFRLPGSMPEKTQKARERGEENPRL